MSENTEITEITIEETKPEEPRNIFSSLFPKLKFEFPFLKPKGGGSETEEREAKEATVVVEQTEAAKPVMVRFPKAKVSVPPPEAVENHETGKTSNPIILWQVYAFGGFLVLRWLFARWNERKGRRDDSSDDDSNSAE